MSIIGDTNAKWTGSQSGSDIKESVLDVLTDTAPMETPLLALANRGVKPKDIYHEWPIDYLGAWPGTISGLTRGEGEDWSSAAGDNIVKMFNRTHIWGRAFSVTHTRQQVQPYGVSDQFAYEASRRARKVLREFEYLLHNSQIDVDSLGPNTGSAGNKRKMGGLDHIIANNTTYVGLGTLATAAKSYAATSGAAVVKDFFTAMKTLWDRGGIINGRVVCLVNGGTKATVNNHLAPIAGQSTGVYRRQVGAGPTTINLVVDMVETDFGRAEFLLDRSIVETSSAGRMIGFAPEYFEVNVLRDFEVMEMGKTGPSRKGLVEAEMTCSLLAPNTAFRLASITVDMAPSGV